jgi:hypothetical protein
MPFLRLAVVAGLSLTLALATLAFFHHRVWVQEVSTRMTEAGKVEIYTEGAEKNTMFFKVDAKEGHFPMDGYQTEPLYKEATQRLAKNHPVETMNYRLVSGGIKKVAMLLLATVCFSIWATRNWDTNRGV